LGGIRKTSDRLGPKSDKVSRKGRVGKTRDGRGKQGRRPIYLKEGVHSGIPGRRESILREDEWDGTERHHRITSGKVNIERKKCRLLNGMRGKSKRGKKESRACVLSTKFSGGIPPDDRTGRSG